MIAQNKQFVYIIFSIVSIFFATSVNGVVVLGICKQLAGICLHSHHNLIIIAYPFAHLNVSPLNQTHRYAIKIALSSCGYSTLPACLNQ